jgi:hypothetical protein
MVKQLLFLCIAAAWHFLPVQGAVATSNPPPDTLEVVTVYGERPDFTRLEYGMNLGFYLASPSTANYYNGSGANNLESALTRYHNYEAIRREIGYDFSLHGLPQNMSYRPSMMLGFFAAINLSRKAGFLAEFNYSKLRAEDQFTLLIDKFSNIEGDNIELYKIWGVEERNELRFSFRYTFVSRDGYIHPFIEAGTSITDTKVKENRVRVRSHTFSILNPSDLFFHQRDYGIGMGGFGSVGLKMDVNEQFALTLGYSANYSHINLGDNDTFGLQHTAYIRLNLNTLFSGTTL